MSDITTLMMAAAGVSAAEETDENFNQTVLLLHGDGTNGAQNNTFLDSSTNNFTITRNGNTTQGTFSPFSAPDGRWSNYFDGSGDYLSIADSAALEIGASSFCIESWIYLNALPASGARTTIVGKWGSDISYIFQVFNDSGTIKLAFTYSTNGGSVAGDITQSAAITAGAWYHVAVTRDSTTLRFFLDGVQQGSNQTVSATFYNGSSAVNIGRNETSNANFPNGYFSNTRLVVGSAVYTSAFTPSTTPLTAVSGTSLLTCQSNRFVDNSTNNFAITRNGDVKVTPFSPFAPTAAYDASVNGGSAYLDGTGDYLYLTDTSNDLDLGGRAASLDFWLYSNDLSTTQVYYQKVGTTNGYNSTNGIEYALFVSSGSLTFTYYTSGTSNATISSANLKAGQWNHICVATDASNNIALFVNGVRDATASNAIGKPTTRTAFYIAANVLAAGPVIGYMSNLNFIAGANAYDPTDTTITIPTAPPTAVSGTELLLNFTNAGIFDNTGKNNLETVADAQIDTTTKKYGTGSMEFDGTGDWLKVPNSPDLQLGTGDFTIEFWVYLASGDTGSARGLVAKGGVSTGWLVSLDSSEKVVFTYTTSTITSSGAITTNAWNHIAVVREGTGSNETKIYIGGTNDGTGTVSTDFNQTEVMYIGANRAAGDPMKGFIDDLRITKGVARYTTTFTPPTKAFPDL